MATSYSIAEAKSSMSRLVHEAEAGRRVEITRRGKPVAVLLSTRELARLEAREPDFWSSYERFRSAHDLGSLDIDPQAVFSVEKDRGWIESQPLSSLRS